MWSKPGSGCGLNQEDGVLFEIPVTVVLVQFATSKKGRQAPSRKRWKVGLVGLPASSDPHATNLSRS